MDSLAFRMGYLSHILHNDDQSYLTDSVHLNTGKQIWSWNDECQILVDKTKLCTCSKDRGSEILSRHDMTSGTHRSTAFQVPNSRLYLLMPFVHVVGFSLNERADTEPH